MDQAAGLGAPAGGETLVQILWFFTKPGARDAVANLHLTARRSRHKLTERDDISVAPLIEPHPAHHILVAKTAKMRDRSAE